MDAASPPEAGGECGGVVAAAAVEQPPESSAPAATASLTSVDGDAHAAAPQAASSDGEADSLDTASSSGEDDDEVERKPPPPSRRAPASPSVEARAVKLDDEVAALMTALRSGVAAAQESAALRVTELGDGKRDEPRNEAACAALLAADAVTALRMPVEAHVGGSADARGAAAAALHALARLADCHPPVRPGIARDWPPVLCEIMRAEPSDAALVCSALQVAWYTSRGNATARPSMRRGAQQANIAKAACTCTALCASNVPAAIMVCLRRILAAGTPAVAHVEAGPSEEAQQQLEGGAIVREKESGSEHDTLVAASWCLKIMCVSAVPPSTTDNPSLARANGNAAAVFDAGAAPALAAVLRRQPLLPADVEWTEPALQALGWCVEMSEDRDAGATRAAVASLVALLDEHLYATVDVDDGSSVRLLSVPYDALRALRNLSYRSEARCEVLADEGGVTAALELFKAKHLATPQHRKWIFNAVDLLECVLPQSAACRRVFLNAGGFAGPVAMLAAAARVASTAGDYAVKAACYLFESTDLRSPRELHEAMCTSGSVRLLCSLIPEYPGFACNTLWNMCEDRPTAAAALRDCGGVATLAALLRDTTKLLPDDEEDDDLGQAVGFLMSLSNFDWLTSAIADEELLEPLEAIVEQSGDENARLYTLLAVSGVYSGRANTRADELLSRHDISRHLKNMLRSVLHVKDRLYLGCCWSALEVANYLRLSTVDAAAAAHLAAQGIVPLLLELLSAPCEDAEAVQRQACRTLLNLSFAPSGRAALLAEGAAAKVARFESVADVLTATAAKGLVARLAEGGTDGDTAGVTAAAAAQSSFRVFLSHKRTDAKDFARGLHTFFKNEGVSCFLDFEFKENLHDLGAVINRCDNLIFVLSDNVFASKWCCVELCAAVRAGVNVIFVFKEGSLWTCPLTGISAPHPPDSFVDALELDADVSYKTRAMLKGYKAVQHSDVYYGPFTAELLQKLATPAKAAEMRARAAAGAALLPQVSSGLAALPCAPSNHSAMAALTPHASLALRHADSKPVGAALAHFASEQAHDDAHAFRQELIALRRELATLHAPAARDTDARFYTFSMLLGGAVAAVAMTSCVAVVAVVATLKRAK